MAAALLAVEHFNTRNPTVVASPLNNLPPECAALQFDHVQVIDTGVDSHQAMEFVVDQLLQQSQPQIQHQSRRRLTNNDNEEDDNTIPSSLLFDAIAGPYNDIPTLELSVMATGLQIPLVAHRSLHDDFLDAQRHPYYNQVSADVASELQFMGKYLQHIGRNKYVAILYNSGSAAGLLQKADLLQTILVDQQQFEQVRSFSYKIDDDDDPEDDTQSSSSEFDDFDTSSSSHSVRHALARIKASGFRTIIVLPELLLSDAPAIGSAAAALGLDQGHVMWMMSGGVAELTAGEIVEFLSRVEENNLKFMKGVSPTNLVVEDI